MKTLLATLIGLSLVLPVTSLAQTGGDKTTSEQGKNHKGKKGHKGGKKSKKGGGTTTPPPK